MPDRGAALNVLAPAEVVVSGDDMCSGHGAKFLRPGRRRSQVSGARSVIPCPASTSAADSSPDRRTPSTMSGCRISAAPCDLLVASVWNWRFCFLMLFVTVNAFAASLCGAAAARFDFHQTPLAPVIPGAGRPRRRRKSGSHRTPRWREMDSNHRYRIRNNPFWLPPFGPAIRLPQQKPALSCRGPMVRIHLPPAASLVRT